MTRTSKPHRLEPSPEFKKSLLDEYQLLWGRVSQLDRLKKQLNELHDLAVLYGLANEVKAIRDHQSS